MVGNGLHTLPRHPLAREQRVGVEMSVYFKQNKINNIPKEKEMSFQSFRPVVRITLINIRI